MQLGVQQSHSRQPIALDQLTVPFGISNSDGKELRLSSGVDRNRRSKGQRVCGSSLSSQHLHVDVSTFINIFVLPQQLTSERNTLML